MFLWHANNLIAPNERLTDSQKKRVGYFVLHNDIWWLVNEGLPDLTEINGASKTTVPIGNKVELKDGQHFLRAKGEGGRLVVVQMVES